MKFWNAPFVVDMDQCQSYCRDTADRLENDNILFERILCWWESDNEIHTTFTYY